MPPSPLRDDMANRRLIQTERKGEVALSLAIGNPRSDLDHVRLGDLCLWQDTSSRDAILSDLVGAVVAACPEEEMGGIDTCWGVAVMEDAQACRDRPAMKFPRESVSSNLAKRPAAAACDDAVSVRFPSRPQPAIAGAPAVNLRPETRVQWNTRTPHSRRLQHPHI